MSPLLEVNISAPVGLGPRPKSYVDALIVDNVENSVNNSDSKGCHVYKNAREKPHYL